MLKIKILGCGSSQGVPVIGCKCDVCTSESSYNKRRRSAIIIEKNNNRLLVDFGYDIKDQLIDNKIDWLDGAILTHNHSDHVAGIDILKAFQYLTGRALKIYTDKGTAKVIEQRYVHLIRDGAVELIGLKKEDVLNVGDLSIQLFPQLHANTGSLGLRIGNFVYSTDVREFPKGSLRYLQNMDIWVVDCLGYKSNYAHAGLDQVLRWREEFKPKQIYLTNMRDELDYHKLSSVLPDDVTPCYDGQLITI